MSPLVLPSGISLIPAQYLMIIILQNWLSGAIQNVPQFEAFDSPDHMIQSKSTETKMTSEDNCVKYRQLGNERLFITKFAPHRFASLRHSNASFFTQPSRFDFYFVYFVFSSYGISIRSSLNFHDLMSNYVARPNPARWRATLFLELWTRRTLP